MPTIATVELVDGSTVTGVIIEHRGDGVLVVQCHGERYAGELVEHAQRRRLAIATVFADHPAGVHV